MVSKSMISMFLNPEDQLIMYGDWRVENGFTRQHNVTMLQCYNVTREHNVLEQLAADASRPHHQDLRVPDRLLQRRIEDTVHLSHRHPGQSVALSEETLQCVG